MDSILLVGNRITLREMKKEDAFALYEAAQEKEIWEHLKDFIGSFDDAVRYVDEALALKQQGAVYPFVIVHHATNEVIGSTRYMMIEPMHRRLEIGSTWLKKEYRGTGINTESKYLLLSHGFEQLFQQRIEIRTGHENFRSQRAIERLGAKKEGILRNHMIRPNGKVRHTIMYSIIADEWPETKQHIEQVIAQYEEKGLML